jgi:hypothetical protein
MTKKELTDAIKEYLGKNPDYRDELVDWVKNVELHEDEKKIDRDIEEWAKSD